MAEDAVKTIVLLGPPKAGTTTLLALLPAAWPREGHGFPSSHRYALDEPDGGQGLSRLAAAFAARPAAPPKDIETYSADLIATRPARAARRASLRLIDVPGSHLLDLYGPAAASNEQEFFEALLTEAEAVILVWPMTRAAGDEGQTLVWAKTFLLLAEAIRRGAFGRFEAVIAAFSRFDAAVAPAGSFAARHALNPSRARAAIRARLSRDDAFLSALREIAAGGTSVEAMPVSAHGLLDGYSQANWLDGFLPSGGADGAASLLGASGASGGLASELETFWTPLFALDPFIRVAFGERHGLMFSIEDIAGGATGRGLGRVSRRT